METNNKLSLDKIGKELPFSVPENYFEQFATQIDEQIGFKSSSKKKFLRPWMYMAAAVFTGIAVLTPVLYTTNSQRTAIQTTENYESYVLSQVDETVLLDCYVNDVPATK